MRLSLAPKVNSGRTRLVVVNAAPQLRDPGFRFDPSNNRWLRDPNMAGKSTVTITPKSGPAFTAWPIMHTFLVDNKLKTISIEEARSLMRKGATLLDVRLAEDYEVEHAEGAINVPLYRRTAGNETWDVMKKLFLGFLAMKATESNPDFISQVDKALRGKKRQKVIVMCAVGGTLDTITRNTVTGKTCATDKERAFGRETRSLKACYQLMVNGYGDVVHLDGGLGVWRHEDYPLAGSAYTPLDN